LGGAQWLVAIDMMIKTASALRTDNFFTNSALITPVHKVKDVRHNAAHLAFICKNPELRETLAAY
jgi:hypothetical protein